jgi:integrase
VLFVGKRSKTWYYQRDVAGRTVRKNIGRYPLISAAAARQAAQAHALDMSRGTGKTYQIGAPTLEEALETYLARPKLRSQTNIAGVRAQMHQHLRDWMKVPIDQITRGMVVRRHSELVKTPSTANHLLGDLRTVWNHARRVHNLPESPTNAIEWYPSKPDGRIIDDLREWARVVSSLENPIHAAYFRLLLFTGFRKSEARSLRWEHVHPDRVHLPMTKNGRPFDLPITHIHQEILEPSRRLSRDWVFPAPKSESGHLISPERLAWSPHAHRRTFATVAVEAGVLEEVVGRLLNHTPVSVTGQRYARPSLDALRPSMEVACRELMKRTELGNALATCESHPTTA